MGQTVISLDGTTRQNGNGGHIRVKTQGAAPNSHGRGREKPEAALVVAEASKRRCIRNHQRPEPRSSCEILVNMHQSRCRAGPRRDDVRRIMSLAG